MSGSVLLAITKGDIADYVQALFLVYIVLIFIRVLLSWIPRIPYHPVLRVALDFVHQVTDPYLNLFRRILPPVGAGGMAIDLSPIIAVIVLFVVEAIIVGAILE
jgi:YggT family protein